MKMFSFISLLSVAAVDSTEVPTIPLGETGVNLPMVVAGTFQMNETEAYESVKNAISAGFTGAHCDWMYFNLPGCGKALKEAFDEGLKREEFFLQASVSGYGYYLEKFPDGIDAAGYTRIQLDETLSQLHVEYLDHVFVHSPPADSLANASCVAAEAAGFRVCQEAFEQWTVLEEYQKAGKIRSLGVSNFCPNCLDCLSGAAQQPVLNQLQMHVGWGADMRGVWTLNKGRGMVAQAYSPLGHGSELDPEVLHGNITSKIAAAHNKSSAEVALKWLAQNNIPLVVKSTNIAHLKADRDLWSWDLTKEEMETLDNWVDNTPALPSWACGDWDETTTILA